MISLQDIFILEKGLSSLFDDNDNHEFRSMSIENAVTHFECELAALWEKFTLLVESQVTMRYDLGTLNTRFQYGTQQTT